MASRNTPVGNRLADKTASFGNELADRATEAKESMSDMAAAATQKVDEGRSMVRIVWTMPSRRSRNEWANSQVGNA